VRVSGPPGHDARGALVYGIAAGERILRASRGLAGPSQGTRPSWFAQQASYAWPRWRISSRRSGDGDDAVGTAHGSDEIPHAPRLADAK
jgi:hypothetical protein